VPPRPLEDAPVAPAERAQLAGTFVLGVEHLNDGLHDSFAQYRRTFRVFDAGDGLMIQVLGDGPERLLKQADGSYAMRSAPDCHITFAIAGGRATRMRVERWWFGAPLSGKRTGPGDAATFHGKSK
jgi:hypothetical protein